MAAIPASAPASLPHYSDIFEELSPWRASAAWARRPRARRGFALQTMGKFTLGRGVSRARTRRSSSRVSVTFARPARATGAKAGTTEDIGAILRRAGRVRQAQGFFTLGRHLPRLHGTRPDDRGDAWPVCSGLSAGCSANRHAVGFKHSPGASEDGKPHRFSRRGARRGPRRSGRPTLYIFPVADAHSSSKARRRRLHLPRFDLGW